MKLPKNYPWTKKQAKALWASVEHHLENLRNPHSAVYGDKYCACCNMLLPYPDEPLEYGRALDMDCFGCPIFSATGQRFCSGIAYEEAITAHFLLWNYGHRFSKNWEAAQTRLYIQLVEIALGERGPKRDW